MKKSDEQGQSLVEFVASVGVLLAFLIGIPLVAKIANANLMSIQALDYAAWRVREGNTTSEQLTRETNDRYFGEKALVVDNEKIDNLGVRLGTGKDNQQIYQANTMSVSYTPNPQIANNGNFKKLLNGFRFPLDKKSGTVAIRVPLENLAIFKDEYMADGKEWKMADKLVITKSLYIDNQSLTAAGNQDIKNMVKDMPSVRVPYDNAQRESYEFFNKALSVMRRITGEEKVSTIEADENHIPKDRMVKYQQ